MVSWRLLNARMSRAQDERRSSHHQRAAALSTRGSAIISMIGTDAGEDTIMTHHATQSATS